MNDKEENIINIKVIENKDFKDKAVQLTYDELNEIINSYHSFANEHRFVSLREFLDDCKKGKKLQPCDIYHIMRMKSVCGRYLNALDVIGGKPCEEDEILEILQLNINEKQIVAKRQPNLYKRELEEYNLFKEFKKLKDQNK